MVFDFPNAPTLHQQVIGPNGQVYIWDGGKWVHGPGTDGGGAGGPFMPLSGGTFTGNVYGPNLIVDPIDGGSW